MRWPAVRLIGSWTLAHFGYRASLIAMPLLALQQTGASWTVGLVSGAGGVPIIAAPWWTRALQQRLRTARALTGLMAAEGLLTLVVPLAAWLHTLTPATMIAAGFGIGVSNAVSGPLNASLLAEIGDRRARRPDEAGVGAARLLATQDSAVKVAMTIAPLTTLPMLPVVGATWTVASEGLLSLLGAALIAGLHLTTHTGQTANPIGIRSLLAGHRDIATGWTVRAIGCAAWFAFTLGLTLLGERDGHGVLLAAVGLTAYSGGAIAGSGLGIVTSSSARPALVNSLSWVVAGLGWLAMACWPDPWLIGAAAVVMGLTVPAGNAATTAMVTRTFGGLERRAALTAQTTVVTGSSTLGMLVGGPLIALIGARDAIGAAGALVAASAAAVAVSAYRRSRTPLRVCPSVLERMRT